MGLDLKDWSESGQRPHLEAGIKASLGWMAARAVCTDWGAFYKQQGGSLTHWKPEPIGSPASSNTSKHGESRVHTGKRPGHSRQAGVAPEEQRPPAHWRQLPVQ